MDLFFDVISDLTFGKSFDALTTGQRNRIIGEFLAQQRNVGFVLLNMWLFHLIRCIPLVASRIVYWVQWYASPAAKRKEIRERSTSRKRRWYENALENREQVRQLWLPPLVNPTDTRRWRIFRPTYTHIYRSPILSRPMASMKLSSQSLRVPIPTLLLFPTSATSFAGIPNTNRGSMKNYQICLRTRV